MRKRININIINQKKLSDVIAEFLAKYAIHNQSDDEDCGLFASPDAMILLAAQKLIEKFGYLPSDFIVHSSWESGGYRPYTCQAGRNLHDVIVESCIEAKLA